MTQLRLRLVSSFTLALGVTLGASPAFATAYVLSAATCSTLGGISFGNSCSISNLSLNAADTLTVPAPLTLNLDGSCSNRGAIEVVSGAKLNLGAGDVLANRGELSILGEFDNFGEVENLDAGGLANQGYTLNEGSIINSDPDTYLANFRGLIDNYGTISNRDSDATISNSTLATLKNRGGLLEILAGSLTNQDQGTLTNVNHGLIDIADGAELTNVGIDSLVLNRALGRIHNEGTFTNSLSSLLQTEGLVENESLFVNAADARVLVGVNGILTNNGLFENWDDGEIDNDGQLVTVIGRVENFCAALITNDGAVLGIVNNHGGATINNNFWAPLPNPLACVHKP